MGKKVNMIYRIISGRYETGTQKQRQGFDQLFGNKNIQFRFDLYFHWYNVIHELFHCLVSSRKISMNPVQEELYANSFAVAYWKMADTNGNLQKLREMITEALNQISSPVPPDMDFIAFFESIWNSEAMQTVAMYGYFQLACVLEAMKLEKGFWEVLDETGISVVPTDTVQKYDGEISSEHAQDVIDLCIASLWNAGVVFEDFKIELELVDNPEVQCVRIGE